LLLLKPPGVPFVPPPGSFGYGLFGDDTFGGTAPPPPPPPPSPTAGFPAIIIEVAYATQPLNDAPIWTNVSPYLRGFDTSRGRNFEYDRMEAGTARYLLSNRDSRFNPDNTSGPYYPNVKPTRRVRIKAVWESVEYPVFYGFTEGYPQRFPSAGYDAVVEQTATDWFFPLTQIKFPPSTTFVEQFTGERIAACAAIAGLSSSDLDLDFGQSLLVAIQSNELDNNSVLEHIQLVSEAENGRFFVAPTGKLTFRARHTLLKQELTSHGIFGEPPSAGEIPYSSQQFALSHDETKLFNRVRITTPQPAILDVSDPTSIADHFERTLEKNWPLLDANEAGDAASYMVARLKDPVLRIPSITIHPQKNPAVLWPIVLSFEIGQRWQLRFRPKGGGTIIDKEVIIDGVNHRVSPELWETTLRLVLADPTKYWILDNSTYGVLNTSTRLAY
jgi:hypothetical protein